MQNLKRVALSLALALVSQAFAADGGTSTPSPNPLTRFLPTVHLRLEVELDIVPPGGDSETPSTTQKKPGAKKRLPQVETPDGQ